jgi:predicted transcriptional regulator
MKYRSRSEIVGEILTSAGELEGVTKTRIMFNAYLSFAQLKDYLAILMENGLLEYLPESNRYRTTSKGVRMIDAWKRVNDLLSEVPGA